MEFGDNFGPQSAAALRQAVTSKGGTTEADLSILMHPDSGLFPLLNATVQAAYRWAGGVFGGGG